MSKFDESGHRRQSQRKPADDRLPFKPPGAKCNSRLNRSDGYCTNGAGVGTDHEGWGRCSLHGGLGGASDTPDGPLELMRAAGLGGIIDMAETMTGDDQEYLVHVSNNALVVTRARLVARMQGENVSAKEMADLTMSLSRIDAILAKFPDEENPDAVPNRVDRAEVEEMDRLTALEAAAEGA
jgi:hypothetical protein